MSVPAPTTTQEHMGTEVSLNSLLPGDLLFWGNRGSTYHVAIYVGDGNFIQAPEPGQNVKMTNMKYYYPAFARRILPATSDVISRGSLDEFSFTNSKLHAKGWTAASNTTGMKYSYMFAMDATLTRNWHGGNLTELIVPMFKEHIQILLDPCTVALI